MFRRLPIRGSLFDKRLYHHSVRLVQLLFQGRDQLYQGLVRNYLVLSCLLLRAHEPRTDQIFPSERIERLITTLHAALVLRSLAAFAPS